MNNDEWLSQVIEPIVDPEREIVDPHHHLWRRPDWVYELDELWSDTGAGHNVVQTIYMECRSSYFEEGPEHLRPVGETKYVKEIATASAADSSKATIAAIVAHADLRLPELDETLDAHVEMAQGMFRGIRHAGSRDPNPEVLSIPGRGPEGLYEDPAFIRGVQRLGERNFTYDTWQYHHQLPALTRLAAQCPDTTMVLDHFSTPLGVGRYAAERETIYTQWQKDVEQLSKQPNVYAKLGGMAMPDNGYGWDKQARPPGSDEFVEKQSRYYHHMIDCFGVQRCMFESNFPVDRLSLSYHVLWNGLKKIAHDYVEQEQTALFSGTARRVYSV